MSFYILLIFDEKNKSITLLIGISFMFNVITVQSIMKYISKQFTFILIFTIFKVDFTNLIEYL